MITYATKFFKWFFKLEAASGLLLLFSAVIALIISNSFLSEYYFKILKTYLLLGTDNSKPSSPVYPVRVTKAL